MCFYFFIFAKLKCAQEIIKILHELGERKREYIAKNVNVDSNKELRKMVTSITV